MTNPMKPQAIPRSAGFPARPGRGFTIIELMIVVAIVAVLAAVAFPSYNSYVRKGNRADARALLQAANLAQERHRLGNTSYSSATTNLVPPCPSSGTCSSDQRHYTLAISNATATGYTLTANAASASQLADTGCTAMTLTVSGTQITHAPATCWSK